MSSDCSSVSLTHLGVLRLQGADALTFLQGQLSSDVTQLNGPRALLAGYHNPQGRVIAVLRLVQLAPGDVLALLPRELIESVRQRLSKFVLRAKVKLTDESAHWQVAGLISAGRAPGTALPAENGTAAHIESSLVWRLPGEPPRWLRLTPIDQTPILADATPAEPQLWQRLTIAAGEPQVYAATSEEFVAQMLNLDVLGGIAFDKGCYTGQEVIARAHYRGRVKRRVQRFLTLAPAVLQPADSGVFQDGRAFKVVDGVRLEDGRCEFLAVAALPSDAATGESARADSATPAAVESLPLPYPLPE
jgi:tRNA-modifying protein YgfZ